MRTESRPDGPERSFTARPNPDIAGAGRGRLSAISAQSWAMSERDLSRCVRELAGLLGYEVVSFEAPLAAVRKRTLLDLYLLRPARGDRPGRAVWVELKSERGRLSPPQQAFIDLLRHAGQEVYVFRPADWFAGRIEEVLR